MDYVSNLSDWVREPVSVFAPHAVKDFKRTLDPTYDGPIFIWDIDRTYLESRTDTLLSILQIAMEKATDKINVPGTALLLQQLKHGTGDGDARYPVFFLTAGPPQISKVFEEKLRIDGIECDGVTYKNFFHYLFTFQPKRLREHVSYKVQGLLQNRMEFPPRAKELLFGDNTEQDPIVYGLYSDIASKRLSGEELRKALRDCNVLDPEVEEIVDLQDQLPLYDPVEHIYIHMSIHADPVPVEKRHERIVATFNSFQMACHLCTQGYLREENLLSLAKNLREDYAFTTLELARSLLNMWRRGKLPTEWVDAMLPRLAEEGHMPRGLIRTNDDFVLSEEELVLKDTFGSMAPVSSEGVA